MKSISSAVPSVQLRRQYVAHLDRKPETETPNVGLPEPAPCAGGIRASRCQRGGDGREASSRAVHRCQRGL